VFFINLAQHTLADSGVNGIAYRRRRKLFYQLACLAVFINRAGTRHAGLHMRRDHLRAFFFEVAANVERQQFLNVSAIH
jgi:hypothetical protein